MWRGACLLVGILVLIAVPCPADDPGPSEAEIAWLRKHAVPLEGAAPDGLEDLEPLREMIGDARIIALGEATHGTREFFQMKHRLVQFLAQEMGFTIFSIEANLPEAYAVDTFVQGREGDPRKLILGMHFWTWSTEAVLEMVRWMREFNAIGKGNIAFTGFDMQKPDAAVNNVLAFLEGVNEEDHAFARDTYAGILDAESEPAPYGVVTAVLPVEAAAGRKLRLSGWIRTAELQDGWAGLWIRADSDSGVSAMDNMRNTGPWGTTPWKRYVVEIDVPEETVGIHFGVLHAGTGDSWFDALRIEVDGEPYEGPLDIDLDFETSVIGQEFDRIGEGYRFRTEPASAKSGEKCLRITAPSAREPTPMTITEARRRAMKIFLHMERNGASYAAKKGKTATDWALLNARLVLQAFQQFAEEQHRDRSMAENVRWILAQAPEGARIVLWAHNDHVARTKGWMGDYLSQWYGDDYLVIGFCARQGRYTARGGEEYALGTHKLQPPPPGSLEYSLHRTRLPRFILDLRQASAKDPASAWLTEPLPFRMIGALAMDDQFRTRPVRDEFDLLIYFDKTTSTSVFKEYPHWKGLPR